MMVQAGVIPNPVGWSGAAETHPYCVCDVFTSEPLEGNQLGVFADGRPFSQAQMQRRNGPPHVYVQLASEEAVAALRPDMAALEVAVNCFAGGGRRWKTRMFYPAAGVPEDPATGSAAGPLAVHLARHGRIGFGEQIEIRQGAEIGRPSLLYATVTGDQDALDSVEVAGSALIVAEGRFRISLH
jgi:predicted PhzF superfamily epimerase YddE/YHI9